MFTLCLTERGMGVPLQSPSVLLNARWWKKRVAEWATRDALLRRCLAPSSRVRAWDTRVCSARRLSLFKLFRREQTRSLELVQLHSSLSCFSTARYQGRRLLFSKCRRLQRLRLILQAVCASIGSREFQTIASFVSLALSSHTFGKII